MVYKFVGLSVPFPFLCLVSSAGLSLFVFVFVFPYAWICQYASLFVCLSSAISTYVTCMVTLIFYETPSRYLYENVFMSLKTKLYIHKNIFSLKYNLYRERKKKQAQALFTLRYILYINNTLM